MSLSTVFDGAIGEVLRDDVVFVDYGDRRILKKMSRPLFLPFWHRRRTGHH